MALNQVQSGLLVPKSSGIQTAAAGLNNETLVAETHGVHYTQTLAGNVYHLRTVAAGTTIPVQATNLVGTFVLLNPKGSGKNLELIRYSLGHTTTVTVVGEISLYWQADVGGANTALASTTSLAVRSNILGGAVNSVALGYSAATFANTMQTNMFPATPLTTFGGVTTTGNQPINYEFNGSVIIPPGTAVTTAAFAAQTAAMAQFLTWVEVPTA